MIETDYAKALYTASKSDLLGKSDLLTNLHRALKRRGHERLLPRIFSEYKKLVLAHERRAQSQKTTPEAERTRVLLELYRTLTRSH